MTITPQAVIEAFAEQYPLLTHNGIYCLFTGRLIATYDVGEIDSLIESSTGSPEERADDLALRLLASSRPSLRWNLYRVEDITDLRVSHPVETLCYLLNGGAAPRIGDSFFTEMLRRVEQYARYAVATQEEIDSAYYAYYRAESEASEAQELAQRRLKNWLIASDAIGQKAQHDKRMATIEAQAEAIRLGKSRRKPKPVSVAAAKRAARQGEERMAMAFLDSILGSQLPATAQVPPPSAPSKPATPGAPAFRIRVPLPTRTTGDN